MQHPVLFETEALAVFSITGCVYTDFLIAVWSSKGRVESWRVEFVACLQDGEGAVYQSVSKNRSE